MRGGLGRRQQLPSEGRPMRDTLGRFGMRKPRPRKLEGRLPAGNVTVVSLFTGGLENMVG